jgi:hypothetical protein
MSADVNPPEPPKRKRADHPHLWTILLSITALVVSGLGYVDSHHTRTLNSELNRPLTRVFKISDSGPIPVADAATRETIPHAYSLALKNGGKTFARQVVVTFRAQLNDVRMGLNNLRKFADTREATIETDEIGDLAPDEEYDLSFLSGTLRSPPTVKFGTLNLSTVSLYVKGTLSYTSPLTSEKYNQPFCFYQPVPTGEFVRCSKADAGKIAEGEPKN